MILESLNLIHGSLVVVTRQLFDSLHVFHELVLTGCSLLHLVEPLSYFLAVVL